MGASNAVTHEVITVCNDSYINAETFCSLLLKIAGYHFAVPITVVPDNAGYQKCRVVTEPAESLRIELLYLPAYPPNLNLTERLWKSVKKKCLRSEYYPDFQIFKDTITDCIKLTDTVYKEELSSLLTLKFQNFRKAHIMTV